jgi:uncharacterized protein YegP (UPF0339 family)
MATARSKTARAPDDAAIKTDSSSGAGTVRFDVFEDNAGRHRWRMSTSDGRDVATSSASFASHDDAQRAAVENGA